jgi:hypothetical protein
MAYTAEKPKLVPPSSELRARIPGWGVDLDFKDRPAVPKENFNPEGTGAHWDFPERQIPQWPRERSNEHKFLTPVFGTSCPPKGVSGAIRRYAFRFSEARAAHWLLLMGADRVDVLESRVQALLSGRPDTRVKQTGILSEFRHNGLGARFGQRRSDVKHHWVDALMFAAPYVAAASAVYLLTRKATNARREAAHGRPPRVRAWSGAQYRQAQRPVRNA